MPRKNTLQDGSIRYIVFKEDDAWYGVGLEFNIVESGTDPREVLISLLEGVRGYVASAKKVKARPAILNQKTDAEYEKLWDALNSPRKTSSASLPTVFSFGHTALAAA